MIMLLILNVSRTYININGLNITEDNFCAILKSIVLYKHEYTSRAAVCRHFIYTHSELGIIAQRNQFIFHSNVW